MHNVYFRLLQSHRTNVSKELNRLRFHWGTRTAREEEDMDNIGAVERDGDEGEVVVDWDSLPDDLGWRRFNRRKKTIWLEFRLEKRIEIPF